MSEDQIDEDLLKASEDDEFMDENRQPYTDLTTVESQRNDLIFEEFPEGPYGSSLITESIGKSSPWRKDQRPPNRFQYENRDLHEGLDRGGYPPDHETHDEVQDETIVD